MLKFAYGHKSHASDVRMSSTGDLTETYTPRTVLIALDGSEDSKFAFYCEYSLNFAFRTGDFILVIIFIYIKKTKNNHSLCYDF